LQEKVQHPPSATLSSEFKHETISGVRFAPLLSSPTTIPKLPVPLWNRQRLPKHFPGTFRASLLTVLMCHAADHHQPQPATARNLAALVPADCWHHIFSFCGRNHFRPAPPLVAKNAAFLALVLNERAERITAEEAAAASELRQRKCEAKLQSVLVVARRLDDHLHLLLRNDDNCSGLGGERLDEIRNLSMRLRDISMGEGRGLLDVEAAGWFEDESEADNFEEEEEGEEEEEEAVEFESEEGEEAVESEEEPQEEPEEESESDVEIASDSASDSSVESEFFETTASTAFFSESDDEEEDELEEFQEAEEGAFVQDSDSDAASSDSTRLVRSPAHSFDVTDKPPAKKARRVTLEDLGSAEVWGGG